MIRCFLILLLLFSVYSLSAELSLNNYGRINYSERTIETKYYIEDGEYYIDLDGKTFIGNSLFTLLMDSLH